MRSSSIHLTPLGPLATIENPIVAPTMQWVPEMGSFRNEAVSCHTAEPVAQKHQLNFCLWPKDLHFQNENKICVKAHHTWHLSIPP